MKITGFAARADIVGRRIRVGWEFVPGPSETLADIPPVTLRRKLRDYAYPTAAGTDPYQVYDSGAFPPPPVPGALTVTDLDPWERVFDAERIVFEPISVAVAIGGRFVEVLRRTTANVFDLNGVALRQRVEILDVGLLPGALLPNTTYYYQLFGRDLPDQGDAAAPYRSAAMATASYGQNRQLYQSLPEIVRRHDVVVAPPAPGQDSVPELAPGVGQLRRFVDPFGIAVDSLRGTAEGLRTLHDIDNVDARLLPLIADWIGWDLSVDAEIPLRRNELKTAGRLYALVGTLPGLRALVTQFTGWTTQVAEFAQNIAQSNQPARRNLYAITPDAAGSAWHGVDDAAERLGFDSANQQAAGTLAAAATLTGTLAEPFALRPGMSLGLAVDGLLPVSVRFARADFADIAQASAAEVARAIAGALSEVGVQAVAGRLEIASKTVGPQSLLEIVAAPTSLIALGGAAGGRLSPCTDAAGRVRLFFETWETPTPTPQTPVAARAARTADAATSGSSTLRRVRYKTFVDGVWRDARPLQAQAVTPQADPAAVALPDGRLWVVWLDAPQTAATRLRWAFGSAQPVQPARLLGKRTEPFVLRAGATLALAGRWPGPDLYQVKAVDFADLGRATAAELVAALNAQLTHAVAAREPNGSISLTTLAGGALATLAVDLRGSTTARAIGFDERNAVGTPGSWDDTIDFGPPQDTVGVGPGRLAEPAAVADPAGGVRLAYAAHRGGRWRIDTLHWNERLLAATANGLFVREGSGPWTLAGGLPSADLRALAVDADGTAWIGSAAGVVLRRQDGSITPLAPALPSADIRDVVLGSDGSAAIACAAGIGLRTAAGVLQMLDTGGGLPSNDVRALALAPDGTLWAATAAGAVRRAADGGLQVLGVPALPSGDVRDVCLDSSATVYLATAAGLAVLATDATPTLLDAGNGLGSADVRAVAVGADGTLWAATGQGVSRRSPAGAWTLFDAAAGLASGDVRNVAPAPDGSAWVATALGVSAISASGAVTNVDLPGVGPDPAARALHTGGSTALELAAGGGANREPVLALDAGGRSWLVWSQRVDDGSGSSGASDDWGLRARIHDPVSGNWGAELALTNPPPGAHASDRTPGAQALAAGAMRIYFASDRGGGFSLWLVDVSAAGVPAAPASLPETAASELAPAPVIVDGENWLLLRSDANVSLAQTAGSADAGAAPLRSARVPDSGAVRRFAGSLTMDLRDLNRLRMRRVFGDLLSYTPNRPDNAGRLAADELYTRGTVGLYISRANRGAVLSDAEVGRLRELLNRFVPINLRAELIVVERAAVEFLYPAGTGMADSYSDDYPLVSTLGAIADSSAAAMPGLSLLLSNTAADLSADPAAPATLSRRSYFPPLQ